MDRKKVKLVKDLKGFAVEELGIPENRAFSRVSNVRTRHVVYHSKADEIRPALENSRGWNGFDDKSEALSLQMELQQEGHHTLYMTWETYANKKKMDCPLTSSMLEASKARLSYLVFHELFHLHCKIDDVKGKLSLEEAMADVFAYTASLEYFPKDKGIIRHYAEFDEYIKWGDKYLRRLKRAYRTGNGPKVLEQAAKEAQEILQKVRGKEVRERLTLPINNAHFLRLGYYVPYHSQAMKLFGEADPRDLVARTEECYKALRGTRG